MNKKGMTFAEWLTQTRKLRGLSQQALADEMGMDRGHVSKLENGRIDFPTYETRMRIHQALKTTDQDLADLGILKKQTFERHADHGGGTVTIYGAPDPDSSRAVEETESRYDAIDARYRLRLRAESLTEDQAEALLAVLDAFVTER